MQRTQAPQPHRNRLTASLFTRQRAKHTHPLMKNQRPRRLSTFFPCALAAVGFASLIPGVRAQTSGSLTPTTQFYNYSTAPWVITGGTGPYPDGGGVATFNPYAITSTITNRPTPIITLDVSPTLSGIVSNFDGLFIIDRLQGNANPSIIAANTGLTINTTNTLGSLDIEASISGGGTAGLTKTGAGTLYLAGFNTYTGGTHVNGGVVTVAGLGEGDRKLGATGAGNGVSINGGGIVFASGDGTNSARNIFIGTGGATLSGQTFTTLSGVISGTGSLTIGSGNSGITLQGANTYTGATVTRTGSGLALNAAGSLLASPSYDLAGDFSIDNTGTNVTNRLSDTAPVTLHGISFSTINNADAASSERIGAVTATNSYNILTVNAAYGPSGQNSLTMASLARQNNSTLIFSGTNLGSTPGAGVANIYSTAAPTLVGGGGTAGTTNISIVPYAIGDTSGGANSNSADRFGSSLVTYGPNGFRPLTATEYATAFGGNATDNVHLTGVTSIPAAGVTANAVVLNPAAASTAAAPLLFGGTINVTSGAFLYSPTSNVTGYVGANLNFGGAEGVITNTSRLFIPGTISGSGGLTLTSAFRTDAVFISTLTLGGVNTYTGNTTINAGGIAFSGTTGGGTNGAFGPSGTIILNAGNNYASLDPNNAAVINNPISVIGSGQNYVAPTSNNYTVTVNAPISLSSNLNVFGAEATAASALIFNGTISGPGSITDVNFSNAATTYAVLNGNNTYSGGTTIQGGVYRAGTDTAFGTGTITFNPGGAPAFNTPVSVLTGVGSAARTLANPIVVNGTSVTLAGTAPLTFTGPVSVNGGATFNVTDSSLVTFNGVVSGGGIAKLGGGAMAFNSPTGNTFTGGFSNTGQAYSPSGNNNTAGPTASAIYANNTSGSAFGPGAVSIGADSATVFSTLAGNFTTSGATSIAGRLSPGNGNGLTAATAGIGSLGRETFNTTLTLSSGVSSSLYMEVAAGNTSDEIFVGGALTLEGTVYIASLNGYTIQAGDTYTLLTAGALLPGTVTFNTTNAALASGVSLVETFTGTRLIVTAVPEPCTYALITIGSALAATSLTQRRKARA